MVMHMMKTGGESFGVCVGDSVLEVLCVSYKFPSTGLAAKTLKNAFTSSFSVMVTVTAQFNWSTFIIQTFKHHWFKYSC